MSKLRMAVVFLLMSLFMSHASAVDAAAASSLNGVPTVCPAHYTKSAAGDACTADTAAIQKLTTAGACSGLGLVFTSGPPASCAASPTPPIPACQDMQGYASTLANGLCSYTKEIASSSASGDYVGDCFKIRTDMPGTDFASGRDYVTSDQTNLDNGDRSLTLVDAESFLLISCRAVVGGKAHQITAGKLLAAGAIRRGWAYGVLTMPYKYYPSTKTFSVNAPIGGYLGYRYGQIGSGITVAGAFTISSVKANTVDPDTIVDGKAKVTGTTDASALSLAGGIMFDVLKSPRGKPFKAGMFMGVDRVSQSATVSFPQNGKLWYALQIGYDFTDN